MTSRVLLLVLLVACGGGGRDPSARAPAPTAAPATADDIAPQMFTVEQLRDGNPQGRTIELRTDEDGKPARIEHWEFVAVDAERATIHAVVRDEAGTVISDQKASSKWSELHAHGQFPRAATTIEDGVRITVPAGTFVTRRYTVLRGDTTWRFWFAVDLPGPPVQFTAERGGKPVMRTQMLRAR